MTRTCTCPGCNRKHEAKGLCSTHYMQQWRGVPISDFTPKNPQATKLEIIEFFTQYRRTPSPRFPEEYGLWVKFKNYVSPTNLSYDPEFVQAIRKLRQDIGVSTKADKLAMIFDWVKANKRLPKRAHRNNHKNEEAVLAKWLSHYKAPSSPMYNPQILTLLEREIESA